MKYVNYVFLLAAVILFFAGLYFWLATKQMDNAAFFMALASISYGVYLHSTKADRAM